MVKIRFDKKFSSVFSKMKDLSLKERIAKQVKKISENPEIGKPMRHDRKGTRELYVKPFRLSYLYSVKGDLVYVLELYHKKGQ